MRPINKAGMMIPLLFLAQACIAPENGYYDANGTYHPYSGYNVQNHTRPPIPGGTQQDNSYYNETSGDSEGYPAYNVTATRSDIYSRPGVYDYNGYYIAQDSGPRVPAGMLPPQGMCRVWFADRPARYEPPAESCNGIESRIPVGAYVIYGG